MNIINSIFAWAIKKRLPRIGHFKKYPIEVQESILKQLLYTAKYTEWGQKYEFKTISNSREFKNRIPVKDYETFKPAITRVMQGEPNVLWPGRMRWFAKSSGTTGDKSKFIPVSPESLRYCHFRGGKDMLALYFENNPDSKMFNGKSLAIGGSTQASGFNSHSWYGDLSAVMLRNLPAWAEFCRTPPRDIALMEEWEEKIEKIARSTVIENVTTLVGIPSWMLILLKRILDVAGKKNIREVWPNLEVYFHGGVNFAPYREQYNKLIASFPAFGKGQTGMHYVETYNASEGFFGIQDEPENDDMLLMLDYGIYYEFIPLHELDKEHPTAVGLDEVQKEMNYALVISTNGGLWRYLIGDTVKFTSLNPFRIKVTGRTKSFINTFGEELISDNADRGISEACKKTGAVVKEYTAGPVYMDELGHGGHQWLIEFETPPRNMDEFTLELDRTLKALNSDYEAKRHKDMALKLPLLISVPQGTFYNWMKKRGKLGGQHKVPRLSNDRKYVDDILDLLRKSLT